VKSDGKYRFSLLWGSDTKEQIRAGELLEKLGNKKSKFLVAVLNEYIEAHPEVLNADCKFEISTAYNQSRTELRQAVQKMVEEMLMVALIMNGKAEEAPVSGMENQLRAEIAYLKRQAENQEKMIEMLLNRNIK